MEKHSVWLMGLGAALALGAGCLMALQPAVNARLATYCSHKLQASVLSFGTGFLALLAIGLILRIGLPAPSRLQAVPLWGWTGGLIGAYMVTVSLLIAPGLGATRWIALVLTGQIVLSLILDHLGLVGYAQHSLTWQRLVGVLCLVTGVVIVMRN